MNRLSNTSGGENSPYVHRGAGNGLIVSGPEVTDPRIPLDEDERAVQVPAVLVVDAVAQLGGELVGADLRRMLRSFTASAFRFETLPVYEEAGELRGSLEHFLATGELELEDDYAWDRLVAGHLEAGRSMRRVHTVRPPLTEYLRWELAYQATNDEPIRILDLDEHPELEVIEELGDAWIFDERVGVRLHFDEEGRMTGMERLDDAQLGEYLPLRDKAWQAATPLDNFLAKVG